MKTVKDLKEYLQRVINNLEWDYLDDDELDIHCNTYRIGQNFIATNEGFISLSEPIIGEVNY